MGQNGFQGVFGKADADATNDVLDGKIVPTGTAGATTVADPNQGLSFGNRMARGVAGGIGGGLQGMSQQGQQQNRGGGGGANIQSVPAPNVSPDYFKPTSLTPDRQNRMFFGGGY